MLHQAHLPAAIDLLTAWIDLAEQIQCEPMASDEERRAYLQVCAALQERLVALLSVIAPSAPRPSAPVQLGHASAVGVEDVHEALAHELTRVRSLRVQLLRHEVECRRASPVPLHDS